MDDRIKVLIIEDTLNARRTIKRVLSMLNCTFFEAETGEKALELLKSNSQTFDVIILDIELWGMNGIETFNQAKIIRPDLPPTIILTGSLDLELEAKVTELGVFHYLTKSPLQVDELRDAVKKAVNWS